MSRPRSPLSAIPALLIPLALIAGCAAADGRDAAPLLRLDDPGEGLATGFLPLRIFQYFSGFSSVSGACPAVTELDDGWRYEGGCEDDSGVLWTGTLEERGDPERSLSLIYDGWGFEGDGDRLLVDGVQQLDVSDGALVLSADSLVIETDGDPLDLLSEWESAPLGTGASATVRYLRHELIYDEGDGTWSVGASVMLEGEGWMGLEGSGWVEESDDTLAPYGEITLESDELLVAPIEGSLPF